jgi:hypothetical protein
MPIGVIIGNIEDGYCNEFGTLEPMKGVLLLSLKIRRINTVLPQRKDLQKYSA